MFGKGDLIARGLPTTQKLVLTAGGEVVWKMEGYDVWGVSVTLTVSWVLPKTGEIQVSRI